MILVIDVTVTGPDWVATGSAAVTVNVPSAAPAAPAPVTTPAELETLRMQQRSQALRWGVPRA